jgi:hypothetical protein
MRSLRLSARLVATLLLVASTGPSPWGSARADDEGGWRQIYAESGITVSTRDEPGHDMPSFRGQTTLRASLLHLLAILVDDTRSKEWAKGVDEGYVMRTLNPRAWIVYSFSHQMWPVQNRDLVMRRTVEVMKPDEVLRVRLVCIPGEKPERSGTIRVTSCETSFVLRKVDAGTTADRLSRARRSGRTQPDLDRQDGVEEHSPGHAHGAGEAGQAHPGPVRSGDQALERGAEQVRRGVPALASLGVGQRRKSSLAR